MSDAPKNKVPSKQNVPVKEATSDPAPVNKPEKASERTGKTGEPVHDRTAAHQAVDVNGEPANTRLGVLYDPAQLRDLIAKQFNDLENVVASTEDLLAAHVDISSLRRHLTGARKWFAKELGLTVGEDGSVRRS